MLARWRPRRAPCRDPAGALALAAARGARVGRRRLRRLRLWRLRPAQGGRNDDPDRRLRPRGRGRRGGGRPGPSAEHRRPRIRAASERRRGSGGRRSRLRQRRRSRRLDRPGRLGQRQRRLDRRSRRDRPDQAPGRDQRLGGRRGTTLTGGTIRATPRPPSKEIRDGLLEAEPSKAVRSPQRRRPTWPSSGRSIAGSPGAWTIPAAERKLVTDHDAFGYFAKRYEITVVGAVIPSQTTQAQPSARDVSELVDRIEREGVKAVFPESSVSPKLARDDRGPDRSLIRSHAVRRHARPRGLDRRNLPPDGGGERRRHGPGLQRRPAALPATRDWMIVLAEAAGLSAGYGGVAAIEDVSFEVARASASHCWGRTEAGRRRCCGRSQARPSGSRDRCASARPTRQSRRRSVPASTTPSRRSTSR